MAVFPGCSDLGFDLPLHCPRSNVPLGAGPSSPSALWVTIPVALGIDFVALLLLFFVLRPWNVRRLEDLTQPEESAS